VAVVVLLGSGATGGIAHWCMMGGWVRSTCCCKKAHEGVEPQADVRRVERADCCEVRVERSTVAPAIAEGWKQSSFAEIPPATLAVGREVPGAPVCAVALPPAARGPPAWHGPPLFVRNCSFLI
jgi:hypothetical protein